MDTQKITRDTQIVFVGKLSHITALADFFSLPPDVAEHADVNIVLGAFLKVTPANLVSLTGYLMTSVVALGKAKCYIADGWDKAIARMIETSLWQRINNLSLSSLGHVFTYKQVESPQEYENYVIEIKNTNPDAYVIDMSTDWVKEHYSMFVHKTEDTPSIVSGLN